MVGVAESILVNLAYNAPEHLGAIVALPEQCCVPNALELIWVDSGRISENFAAAVMSVGGAKVEVVKRILKMGGRYLRLSKDYELLPEIGESRVYAAMVRLMLR